jgi:exo-beta-1,3-glucanase (GH17 family)
MHPNRNSAGAWRLLTALTSLVALLLAGCGGGGVVPATGVQLRPLSAEFTSRKAVSYSPFRTGNRETEVITAAQIREDLELLVAGDFRLIRLFDSSDAVARQTLQVIRDNRLDIKVMLGIYIQGGADAFNRAEVDRGVALANSFSDIVLAVSIGNETMVSWSFNPVTPRAMADFIAGVRGRITQPVTTDDNWAFYAGAPKIITDTIDFAAIHTYPLADSVFNPNLWDWRQAGVPAASRAVAMMDAAIAAAGRDYTAVRTYLDSLGLSAMPIVIGETGWKTIPSGGETYRAHPVNQKMYLDRLAVWRAAGRAGSGPKAIFYFEAFDEPWKGSDDKWGLFNVSRQARYAIQSLYPPSRWEPGVYTAADAVHYIEVSGNPTISANRYTVYAETVTPQEARPVEAIAWNAWESGTTAFAPEVSGSAAPGDPTRSIEITPRPLVWGWGMTAGLPSTSDDLSQFAAAGRLNFSIRTTYPGKIEVGFFTGSAADGSGYDVYLPIASGEYGYVNDGQWHSVSIPLTAIIARGAMAFGMTDPTKARLDMTRVTTPFVIADRYAVTGKAQGTNNTTKIQIDAIHWSK